MGTSGGDLLVCTWQEWQRTFQSSQFFKETEQFDSNGHPFKILPKGFPFF